MPADVRPYLVPSVDAVVWGPWLLQDGDEVVELPEAIDGWDSGTDLWLSRTVTVDQQRLRVETQLPQEVGLVVTASWTSSTSGMSEAAIPVPVVDSDPVTLRAVLPGDRIGGVLGIRTTLATASAPRTWVPGIAHSPGSILAENKRQVALEGTLSMFPVHGIDFSHTSLDPDASWHLESSADLHAPFLGAFRLLLNRLDGELMKAVERGAKSSRQQALVDELAHGVGVLLLELALTHREDLDDRENWPPDSVGDVLSRMLARAVVGGHISASVGLQDLSQLRTAVAGAVRAAGQGRRFE
jgi:hypothetical protein